MLRALRALRGSIPRPPARIARLVVPILFLPPVMAYRNFTDRDGTQWQVWDTVPGKQVRHSLAGGWLTFECEAEKRRLAPIPFYWVKAPDDELERMLHDAKVVPKRSVDIRPHMDEPELDTDAPLADVSPPRETPEGRTPRRERDEGQPDDERAEP